MHKGHSGASLGGRIEQSPARAKRRRKQLQAEERRWAKMAGPVEVRKIDPDPGVSNMDAETSS